MTWSVNKLSDDVKSFIAARNAIFDITGEVVRAVREEFGVAVSPQQVESYDPTKLKGRKLAKKWRDLEATRRAFVKDCAGIPAAQKAVRIKNLERWSRRAAEMGNVVAAADIQEKIAKELANGYQHHLSVRHVGHGGGAIEHRHERIVRVYLPHNGRDPIPEGMLIGGKEEDDDEGDSGLDRPATR